MTRTISFDQDKYDAFMDSYNANEPYVSLGGHRYKRDDKVVQRALNRPETVGSLQTDAPARTLDLPPVSTSPGQEQVNLTSTLPSMMQEELRQKVINRFAAKGDTRLQEAQARVQGGQGATLENLDQLVSSGLAGGRWGLPAELRDIEGWGGLSLDQARRVEGMQDEGLRNLDLGLGTAISGRRERARELAGVAGSAFGEMQQAQKEADATKFSQDATIVQLQQGIPAGQEFTINGQTYTGMAQVEPDKVRAIADPAGGVVFFDDDGTIIQRIDAFGDVIRPGSSGHGSGTGSGTGLSYTSSGAPAQGWRTDRHNNPTAFTTEVAKMGLKEGVDYEVGDAFPDNPNMFTARLLGDPIDTTIKLIDKIGFHTEDGGQRWTHYAMPHADWLAMDVAQKKNVIAQMYSNERGDGSLMGEGYVPSQTSGVIGEAGKKLTKSDLEKLAVESGITKPKEIMEFVNAAMRTGVIPTSAADLKPLGQETILGLSLAATSREAIGRVQEMMGDTDEETMAALAQLAVPVVPTKMKTEVQRMASFMQYLLSGKQINNAEYKRLSNLYPKWQDMGNPVEARRKMNVIIEDLNRYVDTFLVGREEFRDILEGGEDEDPLGAF